jgi:hypothetical protein
MLEPAYAGSARSLALSLGALQVHVYPKPTKQQQQMNLKVTIENEYKIHIWTVAFEDLCGEVKHALPEEACIDMYLTIFHPFRMKHCRLYVDTYLNEAAISANQHLYKLS